YKKTGIWNQPDLSEVVIDVSDIPCRWGYRPVEPLRFAADDFAEFLGYYLSEGCLSHGEGTGYHVTLGQNDGQVQTPICTVLDRMGLRYSLQRPRTGYAVIRTASYQLYQFLRRLGKADTKHVPRHILARLSARQCRILLGALVDGDGSRFYPQG